MHEMGIASSVLDAVQQELRQYPGQRVSMIGLRIGQFAGVDRDSLEFCFEALVKGTAWEPLELDIVTSGADELELAYLELNDLEEAVA